MQKMNDFKQQFNGGDSTIWEKQKNSCAKCWNQPKPNGQRSHGLYVAQPVYLIELDNSITEVCMVSRCFECGWIKHYGTKFLYKLTGNVPDFKLEYWPELRRNNISPDDFERAIFNIPYEHNLILDANKNLEFDWDLEPKNNEKYIDYAKRFLNSATYFSDKTKKTMFKLIQGMK